MPALRERFFHTRSAAMTELTQFTGPGGNFDQGAARACNGASQLCYKHPWCAKSYATSVLFLPRLIRNFFENDGVAHCHNLMHLASMQALAMSGQLALFFRLAPARLFVVL